MWWQRRNVQSYKRMQQIDIDYRKHDPQGIVQNI